MLHHELKKNHELYVKVEGEIISTTVNVLREELNQLFNNEAVWGTEWNILTLDLQNTQMLDSLGLNLIVSLIKRVKDRSSSVQALVKSRMVYQTLLATRMDRQMVIRFE